VCVQLDESFAANLAKIALAGVHRPYPNKIGHLLRDAGDARPPEQLTPAFYGCFDWHSAVHSHWTLARLLRAFPNAAWCAEVRDAVAKNLTDTNIAAEVDYARTRTSFEMPYGVAWLLFLGAEMTGTSAATLAPLVSLRRDHFLRWLDRLPAPIRTGEHNQTAFAMGMIIDAARATNDVDLERAVAARAVAFHASDANAPIAYEPSAFDFLSPALAEADLMRRVLSASEFVSWLDAFLPDGFGHGPVAVRDRSDGKLVHYDGLNLSRAWMLRNVATTLPPDHPHRSALLDSSAQHRRTGMVGLESGDYAGLHWLPSFALMASAANDQDAADRQ